MPLALLAGCLGEVVQSPSVKMGTIQFSARFASQAADDELQTPNAARVVVWRVRAEGAGRESREIVANMIKDLSYLQNSNDDSAVVAVEFPIGGVSDRYEVTVAVANTAGDTIFRGGPGSFVANPQTGEANQTLYLTYTGPGADATGLAISPRSRVVLDFEQFSFSASVIGPNGQPLARALVRWESSNPAIAVPVSERSGTIRANQGPGSAWIRASVDGTAIRDSVLVTVNQRETGLLLLSGGGQSSAIGSLLPQPVVFRVRGAGGVPLAGVTVNFAAPGAGSAVSPATAVSDQSGLVQTRWTLGSTIGAQTLQATTPAAPGVTAVVSATALRITPANAVVQVVSLLPSLIERSVGTATLTVSVSAGGVPLAGETVTFTATGSPGTGSFEPTSGSVVTDASGRAVIKYRSTEAGSHTITARLGNQATATGVVQVAERSTTVASLVIIAGNGQSVPLGASFPVPLVVEARNAAGQPVPGAFIDWGRGSGDARRLTGADGRSIMGFKLNSTSELGPGRIFVRVVGTSIQVVFDYTAVP